MKTELIKNGKANKSRLKHELWYAKRLKEELMVVYLSPNDDTEVVPIDIQLKLVDYSILYLKELISAQNILLDRLKNKTP